MSQLCKTLFAVACLAALALLLTGCCCCASSPKASVRLNQIQVIGTHNSYHQRTSEPIFKLIAEKNPKGAVQLDYTHRPLPEQLEQLGIRQIELDCYLDPDGGRFAHPLGPQKVIEAGLPRVPSNDPTGKLLKPGIKVMHIPDIDYTSSVLTLADGLRQVREWSVQHPHHIPIFILIELKDETLGVGWTQALPWDAAGLVELEREILAVIPRESILTPDDVRGAAKTLPGALREHGWPTLDAARGKIMFGMDNEGREREIYLQGHPALENRVLFVSVPAENPAAAWMKLNDPIYDFDKIQSSVKAGFLVRTRADEPGIHAPVNDTRMRDRALASGAQFISSDYPEPNLKLSSYCVQFENHHIARLNPVNGPPNARDKIAE